MKTQKSDNNLVRYFPNGNVQIKLDNILTPDQILEPDMPLLKVEGEHYDDIQLLNVRDQDGMVYLKIKDLKTGRIGEISHRFGPDHLNFVWWVVSYEFIVHLVAQQDSNQFKGMDLLEFEY